MLAPPLRASLLPLALLLAAGCAGDRPGMLGAPPATESQVAVKYDLTARPFPEVPLPSDAATRLDDDSVTGRFVNISKLGVTFLESDTRSLADQLAGFGTYSPITVPLTGRIDLGNIVTRQWENTDYSDDVALVIDIDPESPGFGEAVPLDFGQGNFPLILERTDNYFDNDPRADGQNLLFEDHDEDANANGRLDPGEDSNGDEVLGLPNVFPGMAEARADDPTFFPGVDDLVTFFELETNTLIFRPVVPLRQRTRYAVVLTKNLVDEAGLTVRGPFDGIHPASQKEALKPLPDLLGKYGFSTDDVVLSWVFTTQDITGDLEAIRAGLYAHGPFAKLAAEFPVDDLTLFPLKDDGQGQIYTVPMNLFLPLLQIIAGDLIGGSDEGQKLFIEDMKHIDYLLVGSLPGPNFLADQDGLAEGDYPMDDDESFRMNRKTGEAFYGRTDITFWCAVPRAGMGAEAPFPLAIYGHGYTSSRLEMLGFAGRMARFGTAICSLDAYGHGPGLPDDKIDLKPLIKADTIPGALQEVFGKLGYGNFARTFSIGRYRDLNNDGKPDSGGDFWTYDIFHTRDIVRQSIVDHLQFVRWIRGFDGERRWRFDTDGDGRADLAGDFNGDGVIDFGGPSNPLSMFGGSLGAILSGVMGGIEPALDGAIPVAGGAGLIDIGIRSRQGGVPEAVFMPFFGPLIAGHPLKDKPGTVELIFVVNDVNRRRRVRFYLSKSIRPGDRLELLNLRNGEVDGAVAGPDSRFRLAVPADALSATEKRPVLGMLPDNRNVPVTVTRPEALGDPLVIRVYDGLYGEVKEEIDSWNVDGVWQGARYLAGTRLTSIAKGHGKKRQTPDFRRFVSLAAMVLEPGDPAGYAPHYALDPLDFSYDPGIQDGTITPGNNMLLIPSIGDMNVPVNTGVAMARAAGLIDLFDTNTPWGMTENDVLIRNHILEGTERVPRYLVEDAEGKKQSVLFDVDDLNFGSEEFGEPNLDPPLRLSKLLGPGDGYRIALRLPYVQPSGTHGFSAPQPDRPFDIEMFMNNQVGWFLLTRGREVSDDPCLESVSCDFLPERVKIGLPPPSTETSPGK